MRTATLSGLALLLAVGCTHTRTAANPAQEERATQREEAQSEREEAKSERKDDKESKADKSGEPDAAKSAAGGGHDHTSDGRQRNHDARDEDGGGERGEQRSDGKKQDAAEDIDVSTNAGGLLAPGAQDRVRDKLGAPPGDAALRQAVQRFQREHGLPATGVLDHETVERLGLPPGEIFRK